MDTTNTAALNAAKIRTEAKRGDAIEWARRDLARMPAHDNPALRPCVVVAWTRNRRGRLINPRMFSRYHAEPVGQSCNVDGFDWAMVVADDASRSLSVTL